MSVKKICKGMKEAVVVLLTLFCVGCSRLDDFSSRSVGDVDYLCIYTQGEMLTMVEVTGRSPQGDDTYVHSLEGDFVIHGSYLAQVSNSQRIAKGGKDGR